MKTGERMTIACLGWGSLIWDSQDLPLASGWFEDGPLLRVEFTRQSNNGRMTLVLESSAPQIISLWAAMQAEDVASAKTALMAREGTTNGTHVASWSLGDPTPATIADLPAWADAHGITGVVWTALPSRFNGRTIVPTVDQVTAYLGGLDGGIRAEAEAYIRRAPRQVNTPYRRAIETALGWTPLP